MQRHEDELEKLFVRLDPDVQQEWRGASAAQIDEMEGIAGRPLPMFYRWFLERMGEDMGSLSYPMLDFSIDTILSIYEHGDISPDGRNLLIGYNYDEAMPNHVFYDLDLPAREDCMVGQMEIDDDAVRPKFETFREMLGWGKFTIRRVRKMPQVCSGIVSIPDGPIRPQIDKTMKTLGFADLLTSGPFCGLYNRGDVAISYTGNPTLPPRTFAFRVGGPDAGTLRRILGELATSNMKVDITEWEPSVA